MSSVKFQFIGKTVLVTGAAQGIGRAIAKSLLSAGAAVYALDKSQQNLDSLVTECPDIRPVCVDLVDWQKSQSAVQSLGHLDLLVNNAAVVEIKPFVDVPVDSFDRIMNVNLRGLFAVSQVFARGLIDRGAAGAIVNLSSEAGKCAFPGHSVYCTSKAAIDHLTRCMAYELGPHKIRVNGVNPTVVNIGMGPRVWKELGRTDERIARIPLQKFAEVSDVVDTVMYLLSDSAAMINGSTLPIDGGFLIGY